MSTVATSPLILEPPSSPHNKRISCRNSRRSRTMTTPKRSASAPFKRSSTVPVPAVTTMMPSLSPRLSAVISPRLSKLFTDLNKLVDDNSTSATSFLSMSLSNHSSHGGSGFLSMSSTRARDTTRPSEIPVDDLDDFCLKILPDHVKDDQSNVVGMLQYGVKEYLHPGHITPAALSEIELGLSTILEGIPSLPAPVVAELHSYRGLVQLQRGSYTPAIESFTRCLWLQSHLMKRVKNDQEEQECMLNMALTEHRLGVALGRNQQYLEAIDQMKYAIQSYERAQITCSEVCFASAKEDLHDFQEAHQLSLLESKGRVRRRSQIRRTRSNDQSEAFGAKKGNVNSFALRRCQTDEVDGPRRSTTTRSSSAKGSREAEEVNLQRQDSFSY